MGKSGDQGDSPSWTMTNPTCQNCYLTILVMILHLLIVRHSRYQLTFYLSMILFSHNYHNHSKKRRRRRFPNILASLDICIKLFKSNKNDILTYTAYKNIEEIRPMVNGSLPLESEKPKKTKHVKSN